MRSVTIQNGLPLRLRAALLASTALAAALLLPATGPARAQDATWLATPGSGNYYDANNWSPASVPTGTAFFGTSATTALTLGTAGSIGGWTLNAGASTYSFAFTADQTFTGAGIVINGGSAAITNNAFLYFANTSTAGSAGIYNRAYMFFMNASTAGTATITNDNELYFYGTSSAGTATINNNIGLYFHNNSTAGNAHLVNNTSYASVDFSNTAGPNNDKKISAGSIAGGGTFSLGANELTVGTDNLSTEVTGVIADGGTGGGTGASLVKVGTGTLTLSGTNSYTGGTTINGGTLQIGNGGTTGSVAGGIADNAALIFNRSDNVTYGGIISGSGTLEKLGAGTLTLSGASTYTGATTVSAGTLTIQGSIASSTITNNATLIYSTNATAGTASITNNSQLTFYGNTTAGSATITNSGTVLFDGNSTADSAQLINSGSNAVVNFWTPGPASDGRITAGSLAGSGRFDLNSIELTFGSNNLSTEVTGVLTGDGLVTGTSVVKTGTGTLTLSGTNTYTGATIINDGALVVNGSIAASSSLTMGSGTTLGGTGQLPTTVINSGATLAPGNSIGTLTVNGNLTFNSGTTYSIEVLPTAADRTNVTGTATLTGATVQAVALPGSFRGQTYTIINATGGLGGTQFAGLTFSGSSISPGARNPHLTYDANNAYLVLDPGTIQLPAGTSGNQSSVADGINSAVLNGGTPPAAFDTLLNMSGAQQTNALNQVSGQPGASGTQASFGANQQFMSMLDPSSGRGGAGAVTSFAEESEALAYSGRNAKAREAYAAVTPRDRRAMSFERRWGVWATGYGGTSTVNGSPSSGTSTTTSRVYGTVIGADYRVSPDTVLGFAFGGAGFNFSLSDGLGGGRADLFQAGLYGRHTMGAAYLSASLSYGWQDVTTDRTVTVSGSDRLTANYKASTFAARAEAGWRFAPWPAFGVGVTPYAAAQVTSIHLPSYSETSTSGSGTFALSYSAQTTTNVRSELGARVDKLFMRDDGLFTLHGRLAWAHDSNTDRPVTAAFQTLPGSSFTVNGAQPAADAALVSAGAEMKWWNGFSLAGTFEGEFSNTTQTYAGKGTVRYAW